MCSSDLFKPGGRVAKAKKSAEKKAARAAKSAK